MPQTARIWEVRDSGALTEIEPSVLDSEERLEDWLANDISILSENLLAIGRQVIPIAKDHYARSVRALLLPTGLPAPFSTSKSRPAGRLFASFIGRTCTTDRQNWYKADLRDTRFDVRTGTIFSLWPDPALWPDTHQNRDEGLYFQVYTYRLAALLEVQENTIRDLLPDDQDDWDYGTGGSERWSGVNGFFQKDEEVGAFVEGLKDLVAE